MLMHVLSYDPSTGFGEAVQASFFLPDTNPFYKVNIFSRKILKPNHTYSFKPANRWINDLFIRAESDLKDNREMANV